MASHMLKRCTRTAFTAAFLRRQATRSVSSTPRIIFAANKYSQQPFLSNNLLMTSQLSPVTVRYFASAGMSIGELQDRVLNVVKLFDKVNAELVTVESHFINDLGLDSLDVVEIVMAFEDEFAVEISDEEAEKIMTITDAVEFLKKSLEVH
ncbi:uncharacterized protein LOC110239933 [Exaiptasia diaphana]|uniref:Acyl carrier protein n=1 Tax=Exaiptasia diaphana TaxID=2652724 RepID=A0A913X9Y5_EXADI|nr:uncharacterized protein LOC110239933 [Exaiptasia diaphana]